MTDDVELRRTQLATPAPDRQYVESAANSAADEVFLDLEDAVAPTERADARESLIAAARDLDWDDTILSYRINGIDTRWWYDDVIDVVSAAGEYIDDVVVPKVTCASDVHTVEDLLEQVEVNVGLDVGAIGLEPQVEDGEGMHNVHEIAHASDRLSALLFGPGDYSAAMGTPGLDIGQFPDYPGHYWHHALAQCNTAAKSADLPLIDGPYGDVDDLDGFRESAERAHMLGCDGKGVVHPNQIAVGNEVFSPDPEVVERAKRLVDAYAEARADGKGAVKVDGQLVDEATDRMARDVVAKARAAGIL
ncbi:HpcH/HpaI aldolase/citrate lyase family protein [Salinirarus marinus]|uniref:HpcH/HpaI aldolase/citrate lyase family protein n=1 Tax=Salinirarus marinus TaxID=3068310 RepID=UPI003C6BF358